MTEKSTIFHSSVQKYAGFTQKFTHSRRKPAWVLGLRIPILGISPRNGVCRALHQSALPVGLRRYQHLPHFNRPRDQLGRNAPDVLATINRFANIHVEVVVTQFGKFDQTSPAGSSPF